MLLRRLAEYRDVVAIEEGELPLNAEKNDVHGAFKRFSGIAKSEGHPKNSMFSRLQGNGCLISVANFMFYLPVSAASVNCGQHS